MAMAFRLLTLGVDMQSVAPLFMTHQERARQPGRSPSRRGASSI